MNWKIIIVSVIVLGPLFWVLTASFGNDPHSVPFVLGGKEAREFALTSLDGQTVKLSDFRGKPVVINFWSTWCEPCKAEHDILQNAARTYGDAVQFLGVVYQDDAQAARDYLKTRMSVFPQLADPNTRVGLDYGVSGVPESFFIDVQGRIRHKQAGVVTPHVLITQLRTLLTEAASGGSQ